MVTIAPSILSADFGRLEEDVKKITAAGADWLHVDVMDGSFVPPITFGAATLEVIRRSTKLPLDVHLMIVEPERHIESFVKAGADSITVHAEACVHLHRTLKLIHSLGKKTGVALNPSSPLSMVEHVLDELDLLLVMTINPGWSAQHYIEHSDQKIAQASAMIKRSGRVIKLEVDGGINTQTVDRVISAGADVLVSGSYIFGQTDYKAAIASLRR
jgi:ribulose-phosphate 3-epimerase